nr:hypothetical protein [Candidatus Sigynarchaeota archaeon]
MEGEGVKAFFYIVANIGSQLIETTTFMNLKKLGIPSGTTIPVGLGALLDSLILGGFFSNGMRSVNKEFIILDPDTNRINSKIRLKHGTTSVLTWNDQTNQLEIKFEVCKYIGPTGIGTGIQSDLPMFDNIERIQLLAGSQPLWDLKPDGSGENWDLVSFELGWEQTGAMHSEFANTASIITYLINKGSLFTWWP